MKSFFSTYYDPANASVVVAGDFDPKGALGLVTRELGSIPSRGAPKDPGTAGFDAPTVDKPSTLTKVVRETMEDQVELPKITMAWQSPKRFAPGDAELDILSSVLVNGKVSRLYQSLVYEQKLAQSVEAEQSSGAIGSHFAVSALARPGVSLDKLEAAIDKELAKVRTVKVSDEELLRAKNGIETSFVARLQGVRARASLLNTYQVWLGDPGFAQRDLDRYTHATSADVLLVASRVLDPNARVILRVVPKPAPPGTPAEKGQK